MQLSGAAQRVVEERQQQPGGCLGLNAREHLDAVVEPAVAQHVVERARGAGLLVPSPEDHGGNARRQNRPGAHDAGLECDNEGAVGQAPVADGLGGIPEGEQFGVRRGVPREFAFVAPRCDHDAVSVHDDRTHGDVTGGRRLLGLREREPHPRAMDRQLHEHSSPPPERPGTCTSSGDTVGNRLEPMRVHVADHPLITHKLTVLRDVNTPSPVFRALVEELMTLLAYEGTRGVRVEPVDIVTPVAPTTGVRIADPKPLIVPILRAGLGMLDGMVKLLPSAEVGFLGMARNEETLAPTTYAERLPDDLSDRQCFVLDPMLATGGSLTAAIEFLLKRGATDVTAICILAAPEGLAAVEQALHGREVTIVLGAVDERLNEHGYIVPGLGDAGDRLYGTV